MRKKSVVKVSVSHVIIINVHKANLKMKAFGFSPTNSFGLSAS